MKRVFRYIIISIIVTGCSSESTQENHDDFQIWLDENRIKPNGRLIDFDYEMISDTDIQLGHIMTTHIGDTLVVSFYSTQPVGCLLIGDIEILKNSVELKFGQACNPHEDGIVTEQADLLFTYKIKYGVDLYGMPFKINGLTKLIK